MHNIGFSIRWREELVVSSPEGSLVIEITMGKLHVYFPDEDLWKAQAPDWAKLKWEIYLEAAKDWCSQNNIPISVVPNTFIYEEK